MIYRLYNPSSQDTNSYKALRSVFLGGAFFENPALYKEKAENYGIKILPRKKEKKLSHKIQNKIDALNAVIGILPSDVDENSAKAIEPSEFFKVYPRVRHWKGADARA